MTTQRSIVSNEFEWQQAVADRVAAPAGGESKGTRYLITTGSGDFTGEDGNIATAKVANPDEAADWYFDEPIFGMMVFVQDEKHYYNYNGTFWKIFDYIINVKDYGVVGDGVTDDTTALKNLAAAVLSRDTVIFPKGIYKIIESIVWPISVQLIGLGGVIILATTLDDIAFDFDGYQAPGNIIGGAPTYGPGFNLQGISFSGPSDITYTSSVAVRIRNSHEGIFDIGSITGFNTGISMGATNGKSSFFNRVSFKQIANCKHGIEIDRTGADDGYVNANYFLGGEIRQDSTSVYVLDDLTYALYLDGVDGYPNDNKFKNISVQGPASDNMRFFYMANVTGNNIEANHLEGGLAANPYIIKGANAVDNILVYPGKTFRINPHSTQGDHDTLYVGDKQGDTYGTSVTIEKAADTAYPSIIFARSKGTLSSPTVVVDGSVLGQISFNGLYNTVALTYKNYGARINAIARGTFTGASTPGAILFHTTPAGSVTILERMRIDLDGTIGMGITAPTSRLHVCVANTINKQALLIEQLDTTNNPVCAEINNDGTNHGLYIHQDGVLASAKYGLYVYSNAVQVNSVLLRIHQDNSSSTANCIHLTNDGTGHGQYIYQPGILAVDKHVLYILSTTAQVNSSLVCFSQDSASSTAEVVEIDNNGTGHGLYIHQDGVLASSKYGLYVYSDAVQVNAPLVFLCQDNVSSTKGVLLIQNDGSGPDIEKSPGDLIFKDANAGTLTLTDLAVTAIEFVIDGGDDTITTGIKGDFEIPFDCTIQRVTLLADQTGDIVVDIWMDTYANYPPTDADSITAAAAPTISAGVKSQDSTLTGWTKTIVAGKTLRFNVDSVTAIRRCTVSLKVIKT